MNTWRVACEVNREVHVLAGALYSAEKNYRNKILREKKYLNFNYRNSDENYDIFFPVNFFTIIF